MSQTIGSFINPPYGAQDDLNLINTLLNTSNVFTTPQSFTGITNTGALDVTGNSTVGSTGTFTCNGPAVFNGSVSGITGTTGPAGPTGATGATGDTGPAGPSGSASGVAVTNSNSSSTFYPVFCSSAGTNASLYVDAITGPMSYVPSTATLTVSNLASTAATALTIQSASGQSINLNTNGGLQNGLSIGADGVVSFYDTIALPSTYFAPAVNHLGGTTTISVTSGSAASVSNGTYYSWSSGTTIPPGVYFCRLVVPVTVVSANTGAFITRFQIGLGTSTVFLTNGSEFTSELNQFPPSVANQIMRNTVSFMYAFTVPTTIMFAFQGTFTSITVQSSPTSCVGTFTRIA